MATTNEQKFAASKRDIQRAVKRLMNMDAGDNIGASSIAEYCAYVVDCGGSVSMNPQEWEAERARRVKKNEAKGASPSL